MYVLLVTHEEDYAPPGAYGPFDTVEEGQAYAEEYRRELTLPIEATPENNELWTNLGWWFGIVELRKKGDTP